MQDALRRDITINALFYNVHTREVEDHTRRVSKRGVHTRGLLIELVVGFG